MTRLGRGYPVKRIFAERTGFAPVTLDAVGVGSGSSGAAFSWNHTVAAGAFVLAGVSTNFTSAYSSVNYGTTGGTGGTPMNLLTSIPYNNVSSNGWLSLYYLFNAPGGTKQITATPVSGGSSAAGNSISYKNVGPLNWQTSYGTSSSGSYGPVTVNCSNGMYAVVLYSCLGASARGPQTFSGGTKEFLVNGNFAECSTWVQDAPNASTTFSATSNGTSDVWASVQLYLSGPVPR